MVIRNLKIGAHLNDAIMQATAIGSPTSMAIPHFLNYLFGVSKDDNPIDVFLLNKVDS